MAFEMKNFSLEGKIALIKRGYNTFEEKAMIAQSQGAAAIIIYNNVSGEVKMNVGDAKLATCSISQNDGEMLVAAGGGTVLEVIRVQEEGAPSRWAAELVAGKTLPVNIFDILKK